MPDPVAMVERHAAVLAELSELGMAFARDARRDAEAAETPEERARQALVFQRVARSIRQTLALEAKLTREAQRAGRESAEARRREDGMKAVRRKERLAARIQELTWRERENLSEEEEDELDELASDLIHGESLSETFLTDEIEVQVGRILAAIGYEPAPAGGVRRISCPEPAFESSD